MKYFITFLLLFSTLSFSQKYNSVKVTYATVLEEIKNEKNVSNSILDKLNESIKEKKLLLEVNSKGVLFTEDKPLDDKEKLTSKLVSAVYLIYNFFTDKKANKTYKILDNLLVESNSEFNWQLTTESKIIDAFTCYKATCTVSYVSNKGNTSTRMYTAWYAPEINFNFGPNGVSGLPGLILELEFNKTKLVAKEIQLFKEDIEINFPNYKTVSEEDFVEKTKQTLK